MKSKTDFFEYDLYQASIKGNIFERIYHIQRVNEVYKNISTAQFLDFGCNTGLYLIHFLEKNINISGFDISKNNLNIAKKHLENHNLKTNLYLEKLPEKKWDIILLINVLEYVSDKDKLINSLNKYLTHDGFIIAGIVWDKHPIDKFNWLRSIFSNRDLKEIKTTESQNKITTHLMKKIFEDNKFKCVKSFFGFGLFNHYFIFKKI